MPDSIQPTPTPFTPVPTPSQKAPDAEEQCFQECLDELQQYVVLVEGSHFIVDLDLWKDEAERNPNGPRHYRQYKRSELVKAYIAAGFDGKQVDKLLSLFQGDEKAHAVEKAYDVESLPLRPSGYQLIGRTPWFVHHDSSPLKPVPGNPQAVLREICLMFGNEAPLLIGWLKGAYTRQLNYAAEVRGQDAPYPKVASQTLAIVGTQGTGKTHVLLDLIFRGLLGEYTNMPASWLTGESRFNDWALKSNIWVADDGVSLQTMANRKAAASILKNAGYSSKVTIECKNKAVINLDFPCERIFVVNNEESALRALPAYEENEDKYLFLFNCAPSGLLAEWNNDIDALGKAIEAAMPAFAHWLLNEYVLPEWAVEGTSRHTVTDFGYMSPAVRQSLSEQDEVGIMMSRLRKGYASNFLHHDLCNRWLSPVKISSLLEDIENKPDCTTPTKLGHLLTTCSRRWPSLIETRVRSHTTEYKLKENDDAWGNALDIETGDMEIAQPDPVLLAAAGLPEDFNPAQEPETEAEPEVA